MWDKGGAQEVLEKKLKKAEETGRLLKTSRASEGCAQDQEKPAGVTAEAALQSWQAGLGKGARVLEPALAGTSLPSILFSDVMLLTHQLCHLPVK